MSEAVYYYNNTIQLVTNIQLSSMAYNCFVQAYNLS